MAHLEYGHFRRSKKPDGWPPGAGPPADVKQSPPPRPAEAGLDGIKQPGHQIEGKKLPLVYMAGKLQIEKPGALRRHRGTMLEKDGKPVSRHAGKKTLLVFRGSAGYPVRHRIVDTGNGDMGVVKGHPLTPEDPETGIAHEVE